MRRFEGRAALVTGAAHGIGRGIAERSAAEGAAVAVADVDAEARERVAGGRPSYTASESTPSEREVVAHCTPAHPPD